MALARHSSGAQLDKIVRGVRRAQASPAAEVDPEAAAWRLRTRTRYDEDGSFVMTIRGRAELLPVVRAGLDAKRAELQRERAAAAEDDGRYDVPSPAAPDAPAPEDASAQAPSSTGSADLAEPAQPAPAQAEPDLDAQAPGWPAGTTHRQVREAMEGLSALQDRLAAEQAELLDDGPAVPQPVLAPRTPAAGPSDASVEASEPAAVTDADALLALAQDALEAEKAVHPDIARRRRPRLTARIDPLSGWARQADGELLPPSSLQAVMKTLPGRGGVLRLRPVTDADLRRFDLGRTSREANAALRELLGTLDGERCRFPGCTRHSTLHAHHVVYWSDGGPTDLANLVLVCARHHTLIHAQAFQLVLHPDRRLEVRTADGVPVLHHPAQPWGDPAALATGCGQLVSAETLPPDHCDARLDLRYAVSVLVAQAS